MMDAERGHAWEESIVLLPPEGMLMTRHVRNMFVTYAWLVH